MGGVWPDQASHAQGKGNVLRHTEARIKQLKALDSSPVETRHWPNRNILEVGCEAACVCSSRVQYSCIHPGGRREGGQQIE